MGGVGGGGGVGSFDRMGFGGEGMFQAGDGGYDEEAELAVAIASSLRQPEPSSARGNVNLAVSAGSIPKGVLFSGGTAGLRVLSRTIDG